MWETADYWKRRAEGAILHAKYKERPDVRACRIKGLEADKRKFERSQAESQKFLAAWQKEGLTRERALAISNYDHITVYYKKDKYPASTYEGASSVWSGLDRHLQRHSTGCRSPRRTRQSGGAGQEKFHARPQ